VEVVSQGKKPARTGAAAINVASWLGVATLGVLWPIALIWAFLKPISAVAGVPAGPGSQATPGAEPQQFAQMQARVDSLEAALHKLQAERTAQVATVDKAKAADDLAKTEEQIALNLQKIDAGAISTLKVTQAVQNREAADATLKQADTGIDQAKAEQQQAEAGVRQAEAALQQAEANAEDCLRAATGPACVEISPNDILPVYTARESEEAPVQSSEVAGTLPVHNFSACSPFLVFTIPTARWRCCGSGFWRGAWRDRYRAASPPESGCRRCAARRA
jgi:hypothetical protein